MRRCGVVLVAAVSFIGCADIEPCPFDRWPDDLTTAVFMDNAPTCEERQIWYDVHAAVIQAWGAEPEPMQVWFIHSPYQMVYLDGEVQVWTETDIGKASWEGGGSPNLYVATYATWPVKTVMCHEVTHIYWRLRDHDDEFTARFWELMDIVYEPESCGSLVPSPSYRVTGKKVPDFP
jgi:hypothetical protein